MKKQLSLIFSFCAMVLLASCGDKTETFDEQWKNANEAQFAIIATTPGYQRLESPSKKGSIIRKVINSGDGETPTFDQQVKVLYKGWYKKDWSDERDSYTDSQGNTVINKVVFDSTDRNNMPSTFYVNPMASTSGIIEGFSTALQYMRVGDKWEVWIPWQLGYGASSYSSIKGYSTLVFEIELVSIVK